MEAALHQRGIILLFMLLLICSCSRTPKGIIPEKKMSNVLVDMYLADAMIQMNVHSSANSLEEKKALYQSVFDKYGLTEVEYDSSLVWYGKNLAIFMDVQDLALKNIKKRTTLLGDIIPDAVMTTDKDSVDIWIYRSYYEFSSPHVSSIVTFDITPKESYSTGSIFQFDFRVWGLDIERKQTIELVMCAVQGDTIVSTSKVIESNGLQQLVLESIPTRQIQRLYGYLRLNELYSSNYKVFLDHFHMIKYNNTGDLSAFSEIRSVDQSDCN